MAEFYNQFRKLQEAIRQQALIHNRHAEEIRQILISANRSLELETRRAEEIRQVLISANRALELETRRASELFRRFAEQQQQILESKRRAVQEFAQILNDLPDRERHSLKLLGEEGWFVGPEMPFIPPEELESLFDKRPEQMAEWFCDVYRKELDPIERRLINSYPHRGRIIQQAFEAHRNKKYGLSIPVFLAQADGIFWDQTSNRHNLFIARQRREAHCQHASQLSDDYIAAWLHPLSILLPLWMNRDERNAKGGLFVGLNRHQVLHGESTDYDTERNSLKAVSLLSYLHWIFDMIAE